MTVLNATGLFNALLDDDTPVLLQQRILNHATSTKDVELMVRLAQINSLDPEIDKALGRRREADVLLAWATRKGRTSEELVERFSKETRATLLAELAARADLTEELYLELSRGDSASVAVALTANTAAPLEARKRAAARAIATIRDSYSTTSRVLEMFRGLPTEVADHAVDHATSPVQLGALSQLVSEDRMPALAGRVAEMLLTHESNWHTRSALNGIWGRLSPNARVEFQKDLQKVIESPQVDRSTLQFVTEFANRPLLDPVAVAVAKLKSETDPSEIRSQYAIAANAGYGSRREAFTNAVRNPLTPLDVLKNDLQWAEYGELLFVSRRTDFNDEAATSLLTANGSTEAFDVFALQSDPVRLARALTSNGQPPRWLADTQIVRQSPSLLLELYPAEFTVQHPLSVGVARELILTRLGEDDERWITFQRLLPEWDNTLVSLLDAVEQLS
jgi:hypothetical protein